jgi:hypothetical protein
MENKRLKLFGHQPCCLVSSIDGIVNKEWVCPQCKETYVAVDKAYCPNCKETEKSMRDRRRKMSEKIEFLHAEISELQSDIDILTRVINAVKS